MFIQVIQGKVADADGLRTAIERWQETTAPEASGWLGTTGGVTADGTGIAVVRFESEQAARDNSNRPEQGEWWAQASRYFAGEVTFHDCPEVLTFLDAGSDRAGFVQVIQGRVADERRMRQLLEQSSEAMREIRPDVIGGSIALHSDDGRFTQTVYFTSEAEAREGERRDPPPELKAINEEMMALLSDGVFYDLPSPWLLAPR